MTRLLAVPFAAALWAMPFAAMPVPPVAAIGGVALLLVAAGLILRWRALATVAACVFLVDYTLALWVTATPVNIAAAVAFGLALLGLLEAVDLVCRAREATIDAALVLARLRAWVGAGAAALAFVLLAVALAASGRRLLPAAAAPLLAALGALGVIGVLARLVARGDATAPGGADAAAARALDGRGRGADSVGERPPPASLARGSDR